MGLNVEEQPCWTISCDRCETHVCDTGDGDVTHYGTEQDAVDAARNQDWVDHSGTWICESCAEFTASEEVTCPRCDAIEGESCVDDGHLCGWRIHDERVTAFAASVASERDR